MPTGRSPKTRQPGLTLDTPSQFLNVRTALQKRMGSRREGRFTSLPHLCTALHSRKGSRSRDRSRDRRAGKSRKELCAEPSWSQFSPRDSQRLPDRTATGIAVAEEERTEQRLRFATKMPPSLSIALSPGSPRLLDAICSRMLGCNVYLHLN